MIGTAPTCRKPTMKIGVISDTHGHFDPKIPRIFAGVEHILHAGDVGGGGILVQLEQIAPVTAVLGKSDAKSMTQPGSFVLPTPGKNVGTQHVYRNGDVRFRLIVMKRGGLTGITAEKN